MNHYEILEVSPNASPEVIKAAYKSLMQRYHPDKNPDNAGAAEHAILVGQAYEVLSDSNRRAAYDIELKQLSDYLYASRETIKNVLTRRAPVVNNSESHLYLWLALALIIFSGWFILSPSKNQQSLESVLKEARLSLEGTPLTKKQLQANIQRMDEILNENPDLRKKDAIERTQEVDARTIPLYITNLTVNLRVSDAIGAGHALSIPILSVVAGTFDADKFIHHLKSNSEFISRRLAEKLVNAEYDELIKAEGRDYLKKFILDSIGEITRTDRFEEYPSSYAEAPGRYGVVDVLFPESFSVQ